jgi:diguanylate cyclase (GGDEF)-like protein
MPGSTLHVVPTELLIPLVGVAVFVNVALLAALVFRRRNARPRWGVASPPESIDAALQAAARHDRSPALRAGIGADFSNRMVRIVGYAFLIACAAIVTVSGRWPATAPAIYALLVAGALWILVVHDVLPRSVPSRGLTLLEGSGAIAFFTALIVLTGGADSPFFFGYFLVAAGAALIVGGLASFVLAVTITAAYLVALAFMTRGTTLEPGQVVVVGVNVIALWLLSYLASVVAREQRRTRDVAVRLSLHDALTRLYNRSYLFAVLDREIARAGRTDRRFSVLMLDLDMLKPMNDRHGHHFGDRLLREVAEVIRGGVRLIDSAARYGGDEFAVVLPETDPAGALVVAEKLRRGIAAIRIPAGSEAVRTTASIGIVGFPDDGRTADTLMAGADAAMYEAKRRGKDRIYWAGTDQPGAQQPEATAAPADRSRGAAVPVGPGRPEDRRRFERRRADRLTDARYIGLPPRVRPAAPVPPASPASPAVEDIPHPEPPPVTPLRAEWPAREGRRDRRFQVVHHADPRFESTIGDFIRDPQPAAEAPPDEPDLGERPA